MGFKRNLSVWQGTVIALGMVLGSGLFGLPGLAIQMGGPDMALLSWLVMFVLMAPLLYVFITLGRAYPQADGLTQYAQLAVAGEQLDTWKGRAAKASVATLLLGTFALGMPAAIWVAASYVLRAFQIESTSLHACLTAVFLLIATLMNLKGTQMLSRFNSMSLYVILALVSLMVLSNLDALLLSVHHVVNWQWQGVSVTAMWTVMALLFWAFLGWENMSFGLGELRDPQRNIPKVYIYSFLLVVLIDLSLAAVASGAAWQGRDVAGESGLLSLLHLDMLRLVLGVVMAIMVVASQAAWMFGASRMIYSAAQDRFFPRMLAELNIHQVPAKALWALTGLFVVSLAILSLGWMSVGQMMTLINQNFMVLYAVSLWAYWRIVWKTPRLVLIVMGIIATGVCGFLLQGFSWWLLYPFSLIVIGVYLAQRITDDVTTTQG